MISLQVYLFNMPNFIAQQHTCEFDFQKLETGSTQLVDDGKLPLGWVCIKCRRHVFYSLSLSLGGLFVLESSAV